MSVTIQKVTDNDVGTCIDLLIVVTAMKRIPRSIRYDKFNDISFIGF